MAKATGNGSNREQDRITWALAKADMQAVAIRLDALIKSGSETNLPLVRRVIGDLNLATDKIVASLGDAATPEVTQ